MHRTTRTIAVSLLSALVLCSCQGVVWGNLAVLALTVGIFLGTISLGRPQA
jgi:preprotein translocase subunit SecF